MEKNIRKLQLPTDYGSLRVCNLSPRLQGLFSERGYERINFNKVGFSSPKCVRASHEMLFPLKNKTTEKSMNLDSSKSVFLNKRRIGEKLLFDSFPV